MNKLFFGLNLTWPRILASSVVVAVVVAALNVIPAFAGTSLALPAQNPEAWLIVGLVLSCNAASAKDAMAKVFVFFLISQPLIYLFEVPFVADGFGIFRYYSYWFAFTVATIPLAFWAYQIRLKNAAGLVAGVLAVAAMAYSGAYYIPTLVTEFPRYLLAVIFCFGSAACLALVLIPKAVVRALAGVAAAAVIAWCLATGPLFSTRVPDYLYFLGQESTWEVVAKDGVPAEVEVRDGCILRVYDGVEGALTVTVRNDQGQELKISFDLSKDGATGPVVEE